MMNHDTPNPRYKGKNYNPNYHGRRNQTNQQHPPQGNDTNHVNYPPTSHHPYRGNPFQQQRPHPRHSPAQQQRQQHYPHPHSPPPPPHHHHHHPQQHHYQHADVHQYPRQQPYQQYYRPQQQQQHDYINAGPSAAAMQVIEDFRNEVHRAISKDSEGDTHMCQCHTPGGTLCFHGVARLYQNQLTKSAALQHDIVELLSFLIEMEAHPGSVSTQLTEFINGNPATSLRTIVETMGLDGLVTRGFGATVGPAGVELLIDTMADPSDIS
ncbi:hypothetical protein EV127DRAFT_488398 [Xylaria flabelliformis]|nr:hypothetical protein EV127DRAFT_488398 [Xylaria flabelliformis]